MSIILTRKELIAREERAQFYWNDSTLIKYLNQFRLLTRVDGELFWARVDHVDQNVLMNASKLGKAEDLREVDTKLAYFPVKFSYNYALSPTLRQIFYKFEIKEVAKAVAVEMVFPDGKESWDETNDSGLDAYVVELKTYVGYIPTMVRLNVPKL